MIIRIFLSLFTLSLIAYLGINYGKKKSPYLFTYSIYNNSNKLFKNTLRESLLKDIDFYQKRLKTHPSRYQDMNMLAQLYTNRAKSLDSLEYYQIASRYAYKSLGVMPNPNPLAYFVLADIAYTQHDYFSAINYAKNILSQTRSISAEAFLILAQSNLALGNMLDANIYADQLIRNFPSERAYTLRAIVLSAQGRNNEAISDFETAINSNEDDPIQAAYTRVVYAKFLLESSSSTRKNLDTSKELLAEAIRIYPGYSFALETLGDYFVQNKNFIESAKYYKLAFNETKQLNILLKEAISHRKAGETEFSDILMTQIETLLRSEIKQNKLAGRRMDPSRFIRFLLQRGYPKDYSEAMNLAKNEIKNNNTSTETIFLFSWSLELNNNLIDAEKNIRSLLNKSVRYAEVLNKASEISEKIHTEIPPSREQRSL